MRRFPCPKRSKSARKYGVRAAHRQARFTWIFASLTTCRSRRTPTSLSRANNKSPSMWPPPPFYRGWAMAEQGRTDEGIALIRAGLDSAATLGLTANAATLLRALSEAQARAGQLEEALATIEQAFSAVGEQQISFCLSVLWRRGELHLRRGDETNGGPPISGKRSRLHGASARKHTNCARRPASRDCSRSKASATRRARCSPTSTTGSPKASTPPT